MTQNTYTGFYWNQQYGTWAPYYETNCPYARPCGKKPCEMGVGCPHDSEKIANKCSHD